MFDNAVITKHFNTALNKEIFLLLHPLAQHIKAMYFKPQEVSRHSIYRDFSKPNYQNHSFDAVTVVSLFKAMLQLLTT